jgi:hypothetical protein
LCRSLHRCCAELYRRVVPQNYGGLA